MMSSDNNQEMFPIVDEQGNITYVILKNTMKSLSISV